MGTTSSKGWCIAGLVVGLATQGVSVLDSRAEGGQPPPRRGISVVAEQDMSDVQIELRVVERDSDRALINHPSELDELRIGDLVQLCFRVSRAGYVSIWSKKGPELPVQLYPNQFTPGNGQVDTTERCLGERGSGYSFLVDGPVGEELVFMHYSQDEASQISQSDYPQIGRVRSVAPGSYASSTVGFRVVEGPR